MENRSRTESMPITIDVGQEAGDLTGSDGRVIQAAVDYVSRLGGGTVRLGPGSYRLDNSLFLRSGTQLIGKGEETILTTGPGARQPLLRDADWYESAVEVEDVSGYGPGSGIMLRSFDSDGRLKNVVRQTVTRIEGNVLWLSGRLRSNMWLEDEACATPIFPLITAEEETHGVQVEDIVLDGNADENEEINGNYSGGVFIQRCDRWSFKGVTSRNYNGDGFSFQVCDDIQFDHCKALDNANLGFHPGSGSQRPVFRDCTATGNRLGIFFCWGVTGGIVEDCVCSNNRDFGISIGHRDTDNQIQNTEIESNQKVGILFRDQGAFRGGHRNVIRSCVIRDNGFEREGVGVDVTGETVDITLVDNVISDSGAGSQKIGIRVGEGASRVEADQNTFLGLVDDVDRVGKGKEKSS